MYVYLMHPVSLKVYIPDIPRPQRRKNRIIEIFLLLLRYVSRRYLTVIQTYIAGGNNCNYCMYSS